MRAVTGLGDLVQSLSRSQVAARAVALLCVWGVLALAAVVGGHATPLLLAVAVLAVPGVLQLDGPGFSVLLVLAVIGWVLTVRDPLHPAVVPAAWLLIGAHAAAVVGSACPPGAAVPSRLARMAARRVLTVAPAPLAAWGLARALAGAPALHPALLLVIAGLLGALVLSVAGERAR